MGSCKICGAPTTCGDMCKNCFKNYFESTPLPPEATAAARTISGRTTPRKPRRGANDDRIIEMYNAGASNAAIAEAVGSTAGAISMKLCALRKKGRIGYRGTKRAAKTQPKPAIAAKTQPEPQKVKTSVQTSAEKVQRPTKDTALMDKVVYAAWDEYTGRIDMNFESIAKNWRTAFQMLDQWADTMVDLVKAAPEELEAFSALGARMLQNKLEVKNAGAKNSGRRAAKTRGDRE